MKVLSYLLPRSFRVLGYLFTFAGMILGIMRYYFGIKPDLFDQKVFALYSVYLKTKTLKIESNQLIEEIAGLLLIVGLVMIAFAREKNENDQVNLIRLKSFFISIYLNTLFLIVSLFFTFGLAFIYMMILNLASQLLIYIIVFRIWVAVERNKNLV